MHGLAHTLDSACQGQNYQITTWKTCKAHKGVISSLANQNKVATEQITDQFRTREKVCISFFNVFKFNQGTSLVQFICFSNACSCTASVAHILGVTMRHVCSTGLPTKHSGWQSNDCSVCCFGFKSTSSNCSRLSFKSTTRALCNLSFSGILTPSPLSEVESAYSDDRPTGYIELHHYHYHYHSYIVSMILLGWIRHTAIWAQCIEKCYTLAW